MESPPVKQGPWGVYAVKPLQQTKWEEAVKNEIDNMVEQSIEEYWPYMTHVPEVAKVDTNEDSGFADNGRKNEKKKTKTNDTIFHCQQH